MNRDVIGGNNRLKRAGNSADQYERKQMTEHLFHTLQEEHLLDAKIPVNAGDAPARWLAAAEKPVAKALIGEIIAVGSHDTWPPVDTWMTLAEKHLSPLRSVINPSQTVYDRLRGRMLLAGSDEFLVVKGSLSGIQRFIYNVRSAGALKNLRGRSFYLNLLLDAVVERLLSEFGLTRAAVLYNSGGTCCLFIPCAAETEVRFEALANEIRQRVFACHGEQLVLLNAVRATRQTIQKDLSSLLAELQNRKNRDKYAPLRGFTVGQCRALFSPQRPVEESSARYVELGGRLPQAECVAVCRTPQSNRTDGVEPGGLGVCYYLLRRSEVAGFTAEGTSLVLFNSDELPRVTMPVRCEFVAGCGARVQSFEELIGADSVLKRLGILRMDVDNLGRMFRELGRGTDALLRYAAMSRRLDLFFKRDLNALWLDGFSRSTVIIYSGGDDLFIAGEWTRTLQLARVIHDRFEAAFPDAEVGLSGGMSLVTAKYPIIRAAELSAEEESLAKSFDYRGETKNALSLFGVPMRWAVEYDAVRRIGEGMAALIEQQALDKSFLSRLLRYYGNARFEGKRIVPPRLVWLIDYDLSRLIGRSRNNPTAARLIRQCIADITTGTTLDGRAMDSPYHSLQLLSVAARLAELKSRTNNA